jgi:subtilisin family serine protease
MQRAHWFRFLVFLGSCGWLASPLAGAEPKGTPADAVRAAIEAEGTAQVVVTLVSPAAASAQSFDPYALRRQIARLQGEVLDGLSDEEFRLLYRYDFAPGLAGVVDAVGLAKLEAHPSVTGVALGVEIRAFLGETVPLIGADGWHDQGVTGEGVIVAVLDTGIDTDHPDLADDLIHEACFREAALAASGGASPCPDGSGEQSGAGSAEDDDSDGHGTHIAGIVSSDGTVAPLGVAPNAEIMAIKVLGDDGSGRFEDLVAGLSWVMTSHAAVDGPFDTRAVNVSAGWGLFVGNGDCDGDDPLAVLLHQVTTSLRLMGALPIAASGNDGSTTMIAAPACNTNVLSVGASEDNDAVVAQTNSNANLDLLAPGASIQSTDVGGGWQIRSGTSQAAPHAAGCAALLIEAGEVVTVDELVDRLTSSSVAITRGNRTFPRLECMDVESIDDFTVEPSGGDDDVWRWVLAIFLVLILLSIGYWFTRRTG